MASLKQYIKENQDKIQKINESVDNNVYLINEDQFVIEYGKEIDNLLDKFGKYTYNNIYNPYYIQESTNNKLSLNESEAAKNLLVFICEDYKRTLLQELDIYENLLNGNELVLNESLLNEGIIDNIKNIWNQGKEKVKQVYETIKTKIKEVNQLIKDFAVKAINTVKEMAVKLIALLEKFNCTIKELFKKMGFDADKEEESVNKIADELAKNPETLKKNDAYDFKSDINESFEQYGHYLTQINEGIFGKKKDKEENKDANPENGNGETVKQAEKKSTKQMLWSAFKQFMIWAGVCVVIPGIVCAAFPGTFIALLVPLACKLAWNGYKIVKIWKQWQKVKKEWHTYSKVQKWITVIGMIASIIALAINFNSLIGDSGTILSAFKDNGCNLLDKANIGVQPDVLTRGFAAFIKMISEGKFSMDDFGSAFKEITDSFASQTQIAVEKAIKTVAQVGKSSKEVLSQFEQGEFKNPEAWWKVGKKLGLGSKELSKLKDDDMVDVVMDGFFKAGKSGNAWSSKAFQIAKEINMEEYLKPDQALNNGLHNIFSGQGSIVGMKMPMKLYRALEEAGCCGNKNVCSVIGAVTEKVSNVSVVKDILTAATSMLPTIPSVEYAFQNNSGFQVRLGTEEDKFVYEVGKDGVKKEEAADHIKEVEKITNIIKNTNNAYYKKLQEKLKDAEESKKKEIEDKLKTFQKNFEKINNRADVIIFYGTKAPIKESLSLKDYIILEGITNKNVQDNLLELRDHLLNKCIKANKEYDDKDNSNNDKKNTFYGQVSMLLKRIFSIKSQYTLDTSDEANKLTYNEKKSKKIYSLDDVNDVALYLSKYVYNDAGDDHFNNIRLALVNNAILTKAMKENQDKDIDKYTKASYLNMVKFMKKSKKFQQEIENKEWVPLEFEEPSKETQQKIEKTEDKLPEATPEETEDKLKDNGIIVPDSTENNNQDNQGSQDSNNKQEDENDGKEKPILMIAYNYVIDLNNSDKNGPRKEIFTLKNIDENYEFIEIEKGTSKENISIMLGDILKTQTEYLRGFTILNPCNNKDSKDFKTIGDENIEREDFGKLTNGEITDIMNKPKKAKKYIFGGKSKKVTAAETEKEKETEEERAKKNVEAIKKDKKALQAAKKINPNILDDKGNINDEELEKTSQELATWQLGKHKNKSKKGFWNKIKNAFKSIFGNDEDDEKYKELNHIIANESLIFNNDFDLFEELEIPRYKSLKDYILEK